MRGFDGNYYKLSDEVAEALKTDPNTLIYGEKKEQSADQTWRKEILKRVIWLVIAGLMAKGKSRVENIGYIQRGYENLENKLGSLGAKIKLEESN